jgi:hypothetical protein
LFIATNDEKVETLAGSAILAELGLQTLRTRISLHQARDKYPGFLFVGAGKRKPQLKYLKAGNLAVILAACNPVCGAARQREQ